MPVTPTPGYAAPVTYDLVTLEEVKLYLGIDPTNTRNDSRYEALIPAASRAITSFSGRDFAAPLTVETRQYVLNDDDSGYLDVDDAASITEVALANPYGDDFVLPTESWTAMPPRRDDSPVFTYILIPGRAGGLSPEMGFTRNLDVYYREGRLASSSSPTFKVTAQWGWPDTPEDVKMAAAWTLQEWITRPSGESLTSEAIEGWSRAWGGRGVSAAALAIPARARDVLVNFARIEV